MRKLILSLAAAATALAFTGPAAAQFYPAQAQGQGYNSGHGHNRGMRSLQVRIDRIQRDIEQLRGRRIISRDEANGLRSESRSIERRLYRASQQGLQRSETRNIEYRIARLEQHVRREATDGGRRYGNGYSQNGQYSDRDRDGRNDRYEDDQGRDRDND